MNIAVLGLGYGDEGKGLMVSTLCERYKGSSLAVVRFNGSCQAGHTVVLPDGRKHIFSHFGSGTLQGVPTIWSKMCPVSPSAMLVEWDQLVKLGCTPVLDVDPCCPIITPWDVIANHSSATNLAHGTCGVGFGACVKRHEETPYKVYARDLDYHWILKQKLIAIQRFYQQSQDPSTIDPDFDAECMDKFLADCESFRSKIFCHRKFDYSIHIFEGAQGILLDQTHGLFPHVTRSNTTSQNIRDLGFQLNEIYYMSRSYLTRHGNGPMPFENQSEHIPNPNETNVLNRFQGFFRTAPLNAELLSYALEVEYKYVTPQASKNWVITCMDQIQDWRIPLVDRDGKIRRSSPDDLRYRYGYFFQERCQTQHPLALSYGPTYKDVRIDFK